MLQDLNTADSDPFRDTTFDICIIGAGMAGLAIALNLPHRLNVCVLEAGGMDYSSAAQDLYRGRVSGRRYFPLTATRVRAFGGTSNHWTGMTRPLDPVDFIAKPYAARSGWPISRAALDPYTARTREMLSIPPRPASMPAAWEKTLSNGIAHDGDFRPIHFNLGPPTRFKTKYRADIENAEHIRCFINANVTDIRLADGLNAVQTVEARTFANKRHAIRARAFVLATGGLENPRILLNCNRQLAAGIGNQHDLVGRFFAEHPHQTVARIVLEDRLREQLRSAWPGREKARRYFAPTPPFMTRAGVLNFGLRFSVRENLNDSSFRQTVRRLICEATGLVNSQVHCDHDGWLRIASEQTLNPDSRVKLYDETDRFGMRRIDLDWRLQPLDGHTIRAGVTQFAAEFAARGLGRLQLRDWILDEQLGIPELGSAEAGGHHHLCTTRMADSPTRGVVDADQKIFGIDNLYVAGGSVFGSTGHANPTFSIIEMSLRLAMHLAERCRDPALRA